MRRGIRNDEDRVDGFASVRGRTRERGVALRGVALRGVASRGVASRGVASRGVGLHGGGWNRVCLRGVELRGGGLRGGDVHGGGLNRVCLRGVELRGGGLRGGDVHGGGLNRVCLRGVELRGGGLRGGDVHGGGLNRVCLRGVELRGGGSRRGGSHGGDLRGCGLRSVCLQAVAALALLTGVSCSKQSQTIPAWGNATEVEVRAQEGFSLSSAGLAVEGSMKRGPKFIELSLALSGKAPATLTYDDVRAFWDNQELKFSGYKVGKIPVVAKGENWETKLQMSAKVHKWPDKDVVYLALGKGVWRLAVSP